MDDNSRTVQAVLIRKVESMNALQHVDVSGAAMGCAKAVLYVHIWTVGSRQIDSERLKVVLNAEAWCGVLRPLLSMEMDHLS